MSGARLGADAIARFNVPILDSALDLIPGASASNSGGSRNERLFFVRGFDRFQVPLSIDGVRVYLPADNRLDAGFFLTSDLAEIQVQKGYVSVLDGPGGLGGAVNLVTRKPETPLEVHFRAGAVLGRDGSANGSSAYGSIGSLQDGYYVYASGAQTDISRSQLPGDFIATVNEGGGFRDHSKRNNWRVNVKAGLLPNETDEYTLSYTKQGGEKEAPLHTSDPIASQRFWAWPYWDIDSIYFLSTTAIDDTAQVETKAYYNTFKNGLFAYDNATYTTQTLGRAFRSYYDDEAYGGSVQGEMPLGEGNALKAAVHFRRDVHVEYQTSFAPTMFTEPEQENREDTWSLAVEDRFRLTPHLEVIAGASYDWRNLHAAEDYTGGAYIYYPLADSHAWNGQGALIYTIDADTIIYANVSHRTRFPTIFERFSTRFGGATSNPNLKPERATNAEFGVRAALKDDAQIDAALFHSDVSDVIVSVPFVFQGTNITQSQNVGDGEYFGVEISADAAIAKDTTAGLRYTYTHRTLDNPANAAFKLTGLPAHQAFAYITYSLSDSLTLSPNIQAASKRWTVTTNGAAYYRTGSYTLLNFSADYKVTENVSLSAGVKNLFDANYALTDGFPEEGRNFFLNVTANF
ncbi:MAG: TonB-dependent receptor [Rhodobacteraceae bacterium]|nr:TonB-dependent receptor [Paracoccaceae bacterium]